MSQASEFARRWNEVMSRHPGEYATPDENAYIGPALTWAPEGCNWAAMVLADGTLARADPEVGGPGGPFRKLTPAELAEREMWIQHMLADSV